MAAAPEDGEASTLAWHVGVDPSLEELLWILNLKGEDIEGNFLFKEEVESLEEGTKWMVVMCLLTSKTFSVMSLKKMIHFA
jgi:hypothetical protein